MQFGEEGLPTSACNPWARKLFEDVSLLLDNSVHGEVAGFLLEDLPDIFREGRRKEEFGALPLDAFC
eukprot:1355895-Amphidinium_carterae.1